MSKFFLFFLLSFTSWLFSQNTINLEQAITMAQKKNLSLESSFYQMKSSQWVYQNARTQFFPKANLVYTGLFLKDDVVFDLRPLFPRPIIMQDQQNHAINLQVDQVFFAGGLFYHNYQISRLQYTMNQHQYSQMLLDIASKVTEYYYVQLQTTATIEVLKFHLSLCEELMRNTEILFHNGIGLETDIMQWELSMIEIENQLLSMHNAETNMIQSWALLLGVDNIYEVPRPEPVNLDEILMEIRDYCKLEATEKNILLNNFLLLVDSNNYNRKNLSLHQEVLLYWVKRARSDFLPTLFGSFTLELSNDNRLAKMHLSKEPSWQIMANLSFPLFHSLRNISNYRSNFYDVKSQNVMLIESTKNLEIQARQSWFDFDSSANNVIQNEKHYLLAERSLNIIRSLYQQGMTTNLALTDAQNSVLTSNIQLIKSIYDCISIKDKLHNLQGGLE